MQIFNPTITVVMSVHNGAEFLSRALESVRSQTWQDWECLVVNDASTDVTPQILADYAGRDLRFRILRNEEKRGPFVSANTAARQARGEFLFRLDADDEALPHRLATQIAFFREHPSVDAVLGNITAINAQNQPLPLAITTPMTSEVLQWSLCLHCYLTHSTAAFRREAFLREGGYAEKDFYAQDYRLWCNWSRAGKIAVLPEALVRYRIHPTQISVAKVDEQQACTRRALQDHLAALTGRVWSETEILDLNRAAYARGVRLGRGLRALRHWQNSWQADPRLSPAGRHELGELSNIARRKFIRHRLRHRPHEILWNWFQS